MLTVFGNGYFKPSVFCDFIDGFFQIEPQAVSNEDVSLSYFANVAFNATILDELVVVYQIHTFVNPDQKHVRL